MGKTDRLRAGSKLECHTKHGLNTAILLGRTPFFSQKEAVSKDVFHPCFVSAYVSHFQYTTVKRFRQLCNNRERRKRKELEDEDIIASGTVEKRTRFFREI